MDRRNGEKIPLQEQFDHDANHGSFRKREHERQVYGHGRTRKRIPKIVMSNRLNLLAEQAEDLAIDLNDLIKTIEPFTIQQRNLLRQARGTARSVQEYLNAAEKEVAPDA